MAIGRISGSMLLSNLERQGYDLAFEGNLIYLDVNQRYVGINNSAPEHELDVHGVAQVTTLTVKSTVTGNTYSLPNEPAGNVGLVLTSSGGSGTYWAKNSATIERRKFEYYINDLPSGAYDTFVMDIGIANIVYNLTVSRPCLIEVFGNKIYNDSNPYAFLATVDHLTDDGTVLLDDGSVIQQRQYSIFANQEDPPEANVYARITNIDGVAGNVTVGLTYFAAVTDNHTSVYDVNVVNQLPLFGYTGQSVLDKTDGKIHVWYDGQWNTV